VSLGDGPQRNKPGAIMLIREEIFGMKILMNEDEEERKNEAVGRGKHGLYAARLGANG
jgi:hypothetical protein